jgi:hypothetical protein
MFSVEFDDRQLVNRKGGGVAYRPWANAFAGGSLSSLPLLSGTPAAATTKLFGKLLAYVFLTLGVACRPHTFSTITTDNFGVSLDGFVVLHTVSTKECSASLSQRGCYALDRISSRFLALYGMLFGKGVCTTATLAVLKSAVAEAWCSKYPDFPLGCDLWRKLTIVIAQMATQQQVVGTEQWLRGVQSQHVRQVISALLMSSRDAQVETSHDMEGDFASAANHTMATHKGQHYQAEVYLHPCNAIMRCDSLRCAMFGQQTERRNQRTAMRWMTELTDFAASKTEEISEWVHEASVGLPDRLSRKCSTFVNLWCEVLLAFLDFTQTAVSGLLRGARMRACSERVRMF